MNTQMVDFDSWDEIKSCQSLAQHRINESYFKRLNEIGSTKSISKKLNDDSRFVSIRDDSFHVRAIIFNDIIIMHKHSKIDKHIHNWKSNSQIQKPQDLVCLLGFEVLEKIQHKLESIEIKMEELEERILENPHKEQQLQIFKLHRKSIHLKRRINEYISVFLSMKEDTPTWNELITDTQRELDNARQIIEIMENLRDAYQASIDNKSNDIMKFLTILATILLPVNMLTSFFGMNFEVMPLIHYKYGIFILYTTIVCLVLIIITGIRRKKWM